MLRSLDPVALARRQLERDRAIDRTAKGLFAVKHARMTTSAFAFLRGSAGLFYEILRAAPELGRGPEGRAWLTGDLHVQNFGAFRTDDDRDGETVVVFGPNDFDEACVGPVRLDLVRLATSWLVSLDEHAISSSARVETCRALLEGWDRGAHGSARSRTPPVIAQLVDRVEQRTKASMLASFVRGSPRKRALLRGEKLWPVSRPLARAVQEALGRYARAHCKSSGGALEHFEVRDVVRRVAGTGSLGAERFAVLTTGGPNGAWLFDVKEEAARSATKLSTGGGRGAERVARGIEHAALAPPRMLGTSVLEHPRGARLSVLVRRLSPQEDKLDPAEVPVEELGGVAEHLGWLAGRMHRRGATGSLGRFREPDRRALLERAIVLSGLHEAIHLAYVSLR